jgi:hypothetical protein
MMETNQDVKKAVMEANLCLWQVAAKLNINDGNFSRRLRKEFTESEKKKIMAIIEELGKKQADEQ